ncbi:MAG: hypothetical protein HY301_00800 [Verrucomicrobia bacterium]|nr:hypothetical protein [Verrucomicrobiota bacterium]
MSLLKEFAIEPAAIASWGNYQLLFSDFGVARGRLLARYPKDWVKQVESLVGRLAAEFKIPPVRAKTIIERIHADKHKFIPARRNYEPTKDWLANAEAASPVFDAIIASSNPRNAAAVLAIDDLDKTGTRYACRVEQKIPRSGADLARCAQLLLNVCTEIKVIEPNFNDTESRFKETIYELLEARATVPQQLRRFEIHTRSPEVFRADVQNAHFERAFASALPAGTKLKVFFWDRKPGGEKMHPRFLLTELGGLKSDYGWDKGDSAEDTTIVSVVDHAIYDQLWLDYSETGTAFKLRTGDSVVEFLSANKPRKPL